MPIYEYQCTKCGKIFEAFEKMSDKPLSRCKFCKAKVERLISHSSFQLKGTGWYVTDYARKGKTSSDSGDSSDTGAKKPEKSEKSEKTVEPAATKSPTSEKAEKAPPA